MQPERSRGSTSEHRRSLGRDFGKLWSVRVGEHHRALAHDVADGVQGSGSGVTLTMIESPSNNALERTVKNLGAPCHCESASWPAAQLGR
jgi:hypothetical protein